MEKLFAYRKMVIMNSLNRSAPKIVILSSGWPTSQVLVKELHEIVNKHEMEKACKDERDIAFAISVLMNSLRLVTWVTEII